MIFHRRFDLQCFLLVVVSSLLQDLNVCVCVCVCSCRSADLCIHIDVEGIHQHMCLPSTNIHTYMHMSAHYYRDQVLQLSRALHANAFTVHPYPPLILPHHVVEPDPIYVLIHPPAYVYLWIIPETPAPATRQGRKDLPSETDSTQNVIHHLPMLCGARPRTLRLP